MKKLLLFVLFIFLLSACGSNNSDSDDSKVDSQSSVRLESRKSKGDGDMVKSIIVYYSLTGNTEAVAEEIHKQVDGELLRIETVESYPEVYDDVLAVVRSQRNNNNELPEIISKEVDFSEYDSIFIGAPIWFGEPVSRAIIKCWFWAIEIVGSFLFIVSFLFLSFHYNFSFDRKVL
ncbi:flavodoxin [Enterococcus malodoratus]|uniref:flavodoxin n=1 Tax=Enterococcus malodoratus TaxID=71451 RepID=UPI002073D234|nr:hypothetical protein [Enterococcus malodoratus]